MSSADVRRLWDAVTLDKGSTVTSAPSTPNGVLTPVLSNFHHKIAAEDHHRNDDQTYELDDVHFDYRDWFPNDYRTNLDNDLGMDHQFADDHPLTR
ncbi:hypothetical protein RvY_11471 [Ramazzottius varieornatus]|uniref:Uncharacterized protein n=1 Tax=Ramazzottius varieornatus TaxID=947166 RepID=A0A1D1VIB0_RAMVA|nr:hypothetical protein RvY_11471 [Ramazzottius varieornatus]